MKTKIVFAGVMGAILMTAGANAATTTSIATQGYVMQEINKVKANGVSITQLNAALADYQKQADMEDYQTIENISQVLTGLTDEQKEQRYPSVKAVLDAIENLDLGLEPEQIAQLQNLFKDNPELVSTISNMKSDIETLKGGEEVPGSVAKSIADAISEHDTAADEKYQAQSTADLQIGTNGGKFRDMTTAEKAALASGITSEKVTSYDKLTGDEGTVAELQKAIDGLNGENGTVTTINKAVTEIQKVVNDETDGLVAKVAKNTEDIATNAENIATNAEEILKKITTPTAECTGPEKTCVLMIQDTTVSWTPVTSPVADSVD